MTHQRPGSLEEVLDQTFIVTHQRPGSLKEVLNQSVIMTHLAKLIAVFCWLESWRDNVFLVNCPISNTHLKFEVTEEFANLCKKVYYRTMCTQNKILLY